MAAAAISGSLYLPTLFLGLAAALSISGNDIVYAIQDFAFDREEKLFSIPARLGVEKSLFIARLTHIASVFMLLLVGVTAHLPIFYYLLLGVASYTFYNFHKGIAQKKSPEALFFSCNVIFSLSVFGFILASVLWDVM